MADISVELVYIGVSRESGVKGVLFEYESFGDFDVVGRHVRVVTYGDAVFCRGVKDSAKLGLTRATGGR